MNRRTFLQALGGVVAAGAAAPLLPIPAPPTVVDVTLKPLAFTPAMAKALTAPMPNFHKTYREYVAYMDRIAAEEYNNAYERAQDLAFASGDQWPS